jgi:acyl carrier protein
MSTRARIVERIRAQLPAMGGPEALSEDSDLASLGITSLHLITMLMELQQEFEFSMDALLDAGLPKTVRDIVVLVESNSCRAV